MTTYIIVYTLGFDGILPTPAIHKLVGCEMRHLKWLEQYGLHNNPYGDVFFVEVFKWGIDDSSKYYIKTDMKEPHWYCQVNSAKFPIFVFKLLYKDIFFKYENDEECVRKAQEKYKKKNNIDEPTNYFIMSDVAKKVYLVKRISVIDAIKIAQENEVFVLDSVI
jgi:hypothetical protein